MSCCLMFVNQCQSPLWPNLTIDLEANFPKSANRQFDTELWRSKSGNNNFHCFTQWDSKLFLLQQQFLQPERICWTYWHAKYFVLESWNYSRSRTNRSGAVLVEENEQGHELLEIMTYDWRTGVLQLLPKMRLIRQQQSFLGTLQSSQKIITKVLLETS